MAYNNWYPATYQPMYQMPQFQSTMGQVNQQPPVNYGSTNTIVWVNGEAEAKGYPVAPNNAVALWDSSKAAIYLKQTDASGRPTFTAFDLVERKKADLSQENIKADILIGKEDISSLKAEIEALRAILEEVKGSEKPILQRSVKSDADKQHDKSAHAVQAEF